MNKKRYWLKLKENFFDDDELVFLKSQKNGYEYIYLWMRLLLKCLKSDGAENCGFLRVNEKVPYNADMLSNLFSMNIDTVKTGVELFVKMGMLEIMEDGTFYIEAVQKMIGKESESAERVRIHREKKLLLCNGNITKSNANIISNTNISNSIDINNSIDGKEKQAGANELPADCVKLSQLLFDLIIKNDLAPTYKNNPPNLATWARDIDKLNRIDGIAFDDISKVIVKVVEHPFWKKNILSGRKLREQYNRLFTELNIKKAGKKDLKNEVEENRKRREGLGL